MPLVEKIVEILSPIAVSKGARIVSADYGAKILRILVEKQDYSPLPLSAIEELSRLFSAQLDVEDAIAGRYFLEVGSAGMDRPILTPADWEHFTGHLADVELREPIDGQRRLRVKIPSGIDFSNVMKARLAISDEQIKGILKERKENG